MEKKRKNLSVNTCLFGDDKYNGKSGKIVCDFTCYIVFLSYL